MKTVVVLPGEGIGVEVVDAACAIMTGQMAAAVLAAYRNA